MNAPSQTQEPSAVEIFEKFLMSYTVVQGGDGPDRFLPLKPYSYFKTEAQAKDFQKNALVQFPDCKIARQGHCITSPSDLEEMANRLFVNFYVRLGTNKFAPRVKFGQVLMMTRGAKAKEGNIVALGKGDSQCKGLAWYTEGVDYFAVTTALISANAWIEENCLIEIPYLGELFWE